MSLLEEALEKHPEFSKLWMMRGQIEEQQGNIAVAREVYNKAVSASCVCTFTYTNMLSVYIVCVCVLLCIVELS